MCVYCRPYIEHCSAESTVYTVSEKTSPCHFCCNFCLQAINFHIFWHSYTAWNLQKVYKADPPSLISQPTPLCTVKHSQLLYKRVVKLCLRLHWRSSRPKSHVSGERESRKRAEREVAEQWAEITEMGFNAERQNSPLQCSDHQTRQSIICALDS